MHIVPVVDTDQQQHVGCHAYLRAAQPQAATPGHQAQVLCSLIPMGHHYQQVGSLRGLCASGGKARDRDGLKAQLAMVLGLLVRHATVVDAGLSATGAQRVLCWGGR